MSYLVLDKTKLINLEYSLKRETLRTNRAGSYACSTIIGCNTRKYHGLLVCPLPEMDGGRHVLLSTLDETVIQHDKDFNLGLHKYAGDNYEPKGHKYIRDFSSDPIPKLQYRVGGVVLSKELLMVENEPRVLIRYTLLEAHSPTIMRFKPFLAFRNIHSLSKANLDVNTKIYESKNGIRSRMYEAYPDLYLQFSKKNEFVAAPDWYYNIEYAGEQKRGYDYKEDLFVPGYFEMPIKKGESIIFSAGLTEINPASLKKKFESEIEHRIPRDNFSHCLANSAKQFFVQNGKEVDIMAGYPWLPVRSRDALISLPGLTLPFKEVQTFKTALDTLIKKMDGHLLNEFLTESNEKNYPADIPLWMIWDLQKLKRAVPNEYSWKKYKPLIKKIIEGFLTEKENFSVHSNGLIFCHRKDKPNSWMNAVVNGKPVNERSGFIVETNALWYNALCFAADEAMINQEVTSFEKWHALAQQVKASFVDVFWNEDSGCLNDYVNESVINNQIRPNQLIALSVEYSPLASEQISSVLNCVKEQLLTPMGLRTLSPMDKEYKPKYRGNHEEREIASHNGTVWPWLYGHFYEGMLKVQPKNADRMAQRFFANFEEHMGITCLCSISELFHGDPPHSAKGAISFAMNTAELIRIKCVVDSHD